MGVAEPSGAFTTSTTAGAPRIHFIDWLRVAAIGGVFLFHTFRPFDDTGWHVKNGETSVVIGALLTFFWSFGLALLFLVAGAGVRFALRRRTWGTFVRERTARLLVPFVAGVLLLSPLQAFIEANHRGTYAGPPLAFVGDWYGGALARLGQLPSPTVFGLGYHLWFLGFLFAISVLALPVCGALAGTRGRAALDALAGRSSLPGFSLLFAIPIALAVGIAAPFGTAEHDWFELGWYFAYFLAGYVLFADERFLAAVRRDFPLAVAAAIITTPALLAFGGAWVESFQERGVDWTYPLMGLLFAAEGWSWTLVALNVAMRIARLRRPVVPHLGELVLPVYVVHQPVILAVAFFVVQWPLGIVPKWIVVFGVSAVVTLALVELGLRVPVTRALLGARRAAPPAPAAVSGGVLAGATGDVVGR